MNEGERVVCTITNNRKTGELVINKTLSGGLAAGSPTSFDVLVRCTLDEVELPDRTASVPTNGSTTVQGIPTRAVCTVTEPGLPGAPTGYTWSAPVITDNQDDLTDGIVEIVEVVEPNPEQEVEGVSVATVTVANKLNPPSTPPGPGGLTISKTLTGAPDGYNPAFQIAYSCTNGGPSGTVSLFAGGSATVTNIPNGSVCTVSENSLPEPPDGYTWSTPVISGSPTSPITASLGGKVTVANALNAPIVPPVLPAVVPPAIVPPLPATVPAKATIPTSVPAGGGYEGPRKDVPLGALVLMMIGLVGAVGAATRKRMLREE